jgi:DtxR family transcriptional regulator, Mn-dependent transcriptional regulator
MSCVSAVSRFDSVRRLNALRPGERGVVVRVAADDLERAERLTALGVTPGAAIRLLQRFPGFVFQCDQTELAVEPDVAGTILVEVR